MNIRSITLALVACAAISGVQAQVSTSGTATEQPAQQKESRHDRIVRELGLDADQAARMKESDEKYSDAMNKLRGSTTDRATISTESVKLRDQHDAELKGIFTADQWTTYTAGRRQPAATPPPASK